MQNLLPTLVKLTNNLRGLVLWKQAFSDPVLPNIRRNSTTTWSTSWDTNCLRRNFTGKSISRYLFASLLICSRLNDLYFIENEGVFALDEFEKYCKQTYGKDIVKHDRQGRGGRKFSMKNFYPFNPEGIATYD